MIIDLIFLALMILALIQGYRRGLIVALFSFIAIIIGLAAALKLSTVVASHIGHATKISDKWLPIISFILVFIVALILIRLGARAIQKIAETVMLGWANRLGGILLYAAIYTTVFSIILFYLVQLKLIKPETIQASITYAFIQPWGPKAIDSLAVVLPFFKNMFVELEQFFNSISEKMSAI
ncbi:MAG TPA: CvpA family protein [Chitinophagaceae bacterium]|jgi:membrane protein required for colicin V production|nr:CvpA family protein [Chitinophagaceae bacterium]